MNAAPQPVLIVIAGPNGSGKTTVTRQILRHEWTEGAVYINPDQIAQDEFGDWNSEEAVRKSIFYCEAQLYTLMYQNETGVYKGARFY